MTTDLGSAFAMDVFELYHTREMAGLHLRLTATVNQHRPAAHNVRSTMRHPQQGVVNILVAHVGVSNVRIRTTLRCGGSPLRWAVQSR